jgi:hypothetical protein
MRILWLDMSDIPWDNHILKAPFKPKIIFDEFKIHEHVEEGGNEVRKNNRLEIRQFEFMATIMDNEKNPPIL